MFDEINVGTEVTAKGLADLLGFREDVLGAEEVSIAGHGTSGFVFFSLGSDGEHNSDFGAKDSADAVYRGGKSPNRFVGAADLGGVDGHIEGSHGFGH